RSAIRNAFAHHVTMLGASGDEGATGFKLNLTDLYTHRVNSWPSSDPLVTSVGGTQLHLDAQGKRTAPDNVWNDQALFDAPAASGGGRSHVFPRPPYQNGVSQAVHGRRGTPDISMSAAVDGGVLVNIGFTGGDGITPGYYILGGTSESAPEFAGIVATPTSTPTGGWGCSTRRCTGWPPATRRASWTSPARAPLATAVSPAAGACVGCFHGVSVASSPG